MKEWSRVNKSKMSITFANQTPLRRTQVASLSRVPSETISFQSSPSVPDEGFNIAALNPTNINIAVPVGLSHAVVEQRQKNMAERKRIAENRRKKEEAARRNRQAAREEQREEERRIRQEQKRYVRFDFNLIFLVQKRQRQEPNLHVSKKLKKNRKKRCQWEENFPPKAMRKPRHQQRVVLAPNWQLQWLVVEQLKPRYCFGLILERVMPKLNESDPRPPVIGIITKYISIL
jgi:hypothetical protein